MDSLTHALVADILSYSLGFPQFIPFAVIGAVIIDTDVLFSRISDRHPSLYLFAHGGIAHSLAGAVVLSALAYTGMDLVEFRQGDDMRLEMKSGNIRPLAEALLEVANQIDKAKPA